MSTTTWPTSGCEQKSFPSWIAGLLILLALAGVMMIYIHVTGSHAYDKHGGDEVIKAQRCIKDIRTWRVFVEIDSGRVYHLVCVVSEIEYYDLILAGTDYRGSESSSYSQVTVYLVDRARWPLASLYVTYLLTRTSHRCIEIDPTPFQNLPINFGP